MEIPSLKRPSSTLWCEDPAIVPVEEERQDKRHDICKAVPGQKPKEVGEIQRPTRVFALGRSDN